eukprot:700641-Amphidinium_carterae.1
MRAWENATLLTSHVGGKHNTCEMIFAAHALRAEAARCRQEHCGGVYFDIAKAFDCVAHPHVLAEARKFGFPLTLWRWAARVYAGGRALQWRGQVTGLQRIRGTVIPGCAMACGVMKVAVQGLLLLLQTMEVKVHSMVDDISMDVCGSFRQVERNLSDATEVVVNWLGDAGFELADGKSVIMANKRKLGLTLQRRLLHLGFKLQRQHKFLGGEVLYGAKRCTKVQRKRMHAVQTRMHRLVRLRRAGARVTRHARMGVHASCLFGSAQVGLSPTVLRRMRHRFARACRRVPMRTAPTLFASALPDMADADPGHCHHQM